MSGALSHGVRIQFQTMGQLLWSVLSSLPIWDSDKTVGLQCNLFTELQTADGIVVRWLGKELVSCVILC